MSVARWQMDRETNNGKKIMKKIILIFAFTQLVSCNNESSDENMLPLNEETLEIYLLNNLNDTRGYCIDMMGY